MSKPSKFNFFRRAVRELRAARAIADPAIRNAHRRLAALYVERGAGIGASRRRSYAHAEAAPARGRERREARS